MVSGGDQAGRSRRGSIHCKRFIRENNVTRARMEPSTAAAARAVKRLTLGGTMIGPGR